MFKILLLTNTSAPNLLGVYDDCKKVFELQSAKPLSDGLIPLFLELQRQGISFDSLYFARGPGSFMALKLQYIFAKTLQITKGVKLYATDSFYFNGNSPIKAFGNCYFLKSHSLDSSDFCDTLDEEAKELGITLKAFKQAPKIQPLELPKVLDLSIFSTNITPLYLLPAV